MKKVALHTLGCKVNFAETSTVGRQFVEQGYEIVDSSQPCDVYVLNTCSVTERADRECRQIIRRALRQSPHAYVVVIGCYAQLQPGEIGAIDGVDLVLGAKEKFKVFDYAGGFEKSGTTQSFVSCIDEAVEYVPASSGDVDDRTRAFLKVQDGCDYTCSFCTIPLARGASRSQPVEHLLEQAETIVSHGYKEIVLTGVNVGDYGRKIGSTLMELLRGLHHVEGLERIRISSIEPNLLTPGLVEFILGSPKCCNHFHIPLQSGSDTILRTMRRRYLTRDYRTLIESIKKRDGDAAIGADVLVGFPGETEELFRETSMFLASIPLSYLHVFTYSERPGTPSISYEGAVQPNVRAVRSEALRILSQKKRHAFYASFIGRELDVLFESKLANGHATGLTGNYLRIEAPGGHVAPNDIRTIRIDEVDAEKCIGSLVSRAPCAPEFLHYMHSSPASL